MLLAAVLVVVVFSESSSDEESSVDIGAGVLEGVRGRCAKGEIVCEVLNVLFVSDEYLFKKDLSFSSCSLVRFARPCR